LSKIIPKVMLPLFCKYFKLSQLIFSLEENLYLMKLNRKIHGD